MSGEPFLPVSPEPEPELAHEPVREPEVAPPMKPPRDSWLALASLVVGIAGVPFLCCCNLFGLPVPAAAAILGVIALAEINAKPEVGGAWMAWTGIGCAVGSVLLGVLYLLLLAAGMIVDLSTR